MGGRSSTSGYSGQACKPIALRFMADMARDERLKIPVYSIGAGIHCDGQLLIVSDLLGIFEAFTPKFVKKYVNLGEEMRIAFEAYIEDVHNGTFPGPEHVYNMLPGEVDKLGKL